MNIRTFWLAPAFCVGLAILPAAAESLTIDQAVSEALTANIGLSAEQTKLGIKKRDKALSLNKLYPSVTAGSQIIKLNNPEAYNVAVATDPATYRTIYYTPDAMNLAVSLNVQFTLSAATILSIQQTAIDYDNASLSYEIARQRLTRDVRKLYFQLLVIQETIKVNQMQLDNAAERYRQALLNAENGSVPELTVLSAKVAWENRKPALEDLKVSYSQMLFSFESLLGRDPDASLALAGTPDIKSPGSLPEANVLVAKYLDRRLDVRSALAQIRSAENIAKIQRSLQLPVFVVQYSADPMVNDPFSGDVDIKDKNNWQQSTGALALALSWKLDSLVPTGSGDNQRKDSNDQVKLARLGLEQVSLGAKAEVQSLALRIKKSTSALETLAKNVDSARRAYQLTDEAYKSGARSLLEVQDAELQYQSAQLILLNEKQVLNSTLLDLETALNSTREEIYGN